MDDCLGREKEGAEETRGTEGGRMQEGRGEGRREGREEDRGEKGRGGRRERGKEKPIGIQHLSHLIPSMLQAILKHDHQQQKPQTVVSQFLYVKRRVFLILYVCVCIF